MKTPVLYNVISVLLATIGVFFGIGLQSFELLAFGIISSFVTLAAGRIFT